jgi:hypothetical protein
LKVDRPSVTEDERGLVGPGGRHASRTFRAEGCMLRGGRLVVPVDYGEAAGFRGLCSISLLKFTDVRAAAHERCVRGSEACLDDSAVDIAQDPLEETRS